jgi:hypothetical protein
MNAPEPLSAPQPTRIFPPLSVMCSASVRPLRSSVPVPGPDFVIVTMLAALTPRYWSAPPPPSTVSSPRPPSRVSAPVPPCSESLSAPPRSVLAPALPPFEP